MNDKEKNSWKTLNSEVKFETPWIKVTRHDIINPAGKPGIYGVVTFKNLAIGVLPLDNDYNTWLVGQWRYPLDQYSWEIPEGGCPLDEEPLHAAKRELKEETGYTSDKWTFMCRMHLSNSVTDEEGFIFLAEDLVSGESEPEETEELHVKKIHLKDAIKMVMNNEITDSMSMVGLLKAGKLCPVFASSPVFV